MQGLAISETRQPINGVARMWEMSVEAVIDRKRKIVEVMNAVMIEGVHYGKIPGCGDKPTLYKAGAEVLATTFGLAPTFVVLQTDFASGHREYRVTCTLTHIATGTNVGEGLGSCSTIESKYRWRKGQRLCPECGKDAIIKSKFDDAGWLCYAKKGGCGAKWPVGAEDIEGQNTDRTENPDIADVYNTVLKMAKKRAQVDCTLTAVGASDVLAQDLEDLPAGSVQPRDVVDVEFDDRPSQPARPLAFDAIGAINKASTPDEVRALAPELSKLKGDARKAAKLRYDARLVETSIQGAA